MLPLHLIIGYALGWTFVARGTSLQVVFSIGMLTALAWGGLSAITTGPDGDSDRLAVFAGGGLTAAANVIIGAVLGAAVTTRAWNR